MDIFVDKNIEICPLRDSHLRVCMWAFEHTPCSAVTHHISHRFEVIADYFFLNFVRKYGHFAFLSPLWGAWGQRMLFILGSLKTP